MCVSYVRICEKALRGGNNMKHTKLFKNIALGIACTLGLGGAIGASSGLFNQKDVKIKEAKAAPIEVSTLAELKAAL